MGGNMKKNKEKLFQKREFLAISVACTAFLIGRICIHLFKEKISINSNEFPYQLKWDLFEDGIIFFGLIAARLITRIIQNLFRK